MKVLFVSPRQVWPVLGGAYLRDFHLAQCLSKTCDLTYLEMRPPSTCGDPPAPDLGFEVLTVVKERPYTPAKVIRGLVGPSPLPVVNYQSARISAYIRALQEKRRFDVVQVENCHLSTYIYDLLESRHRPAIISDWHNIESSLWSRYAAESGLGPKRWVAHRTAALVRSVETDLLDVCDAHTVCSQIDQARLRERAPQADVVVIPNGVDVHRFASAVDEGQFPNAPRFLFVGAMDYRPNMDAVCWFVRNIWPAFVSRRPDARFVVVGRAAGPAVRALASATVEIVGTVEDVRPYYAGVTAAVVPLRIGAGTRLKILEAMAAGAPVISTALGAEGIEAQPGRDFLCADTPGDFVGAMNLIVDSPIVAQGLKARGAVIARQYDWSDIGRRIVAVHQRLADARTRHVQVVGVQTRAARR